MIVRGYEKEEILFVYNSCTNQDIYVVNNCPMDTKSKLIFTIVLLGCIGILYLIGNNLKNRKMLMIWIINKYHILMPTSEKQSLITLYSSSPTDLMACLIFEFLLIINFKDSLWYYFIIITF